MKTKKLNRPDYICWMLIPVVTILGLIAANGTLTLQFPDSYYVIAYNHITYLVIALLIIYAVIYTFLLRGDRVKHMKLIKRHLIFSSIGFIVLSLIAAITGGSDISNSISDMNWQLSFTLIFAIIASILSIVLGIIFLLSDVVVSISEN